MNTTPRPLPRFEHFLVTYATVVIQCNHNSHAITIMASKIVLTYLQTIFKVYFYSNHYFFSQNNKAASE